MPRQGAVHPVHDPRHDRENRNPRSRRHPRRRADARPALPRRRRAGLRQDHAGAAVPAGGRAARRAGAVRHAVGNGGGAARGRRSRTAGRSTACTIRELVPSEDSARARRAVHDVPPVGGRAERDDASASWPTSSGSSRRASSSTRCRSCGCWPATRCAIAGRSSRSSSSSPARECTVMLLDDMTATDHDLQVQSIAHGVVLLEQLEPRIRRRAAPAARRQVPRRRRSAAAITTTSIKRGGLEVFPRLVAAEHRQPPAREKLAERHRRARRAARRRHRARARAR